jgi:hypothetical protein
LRSSSTCSSGWQGAAVDLQVELARQHADGFHLLIEPGREFDLGQVQLGLLALEAGVGQARVDQSVEFIEVTLHGSRQAFAFGSLVGGGEHLEREAQTRDRRPQLVRDGARQLLLRRDQPLDAFGHAVQRLGERSEGAAAHRRRACREESFAERTRGLAHRFQIPPDGMHPQPDDDRQADADQAPGQQTDAQIERHPARILRVPLGGNRADDEYLRGLLQAVVDDVPLHVDRQFAAVELLGLLRGSVSVQRSTISSR